MPSQHPQLSQGFRDFLIGAKQNSYGSPNPDIEVRDGIKTIRFEEGPYLYVDSFVGGSPYIGYEHVSALVDDEYVPVWGMNYYEPQNTGLTADELSRILGKVLAKPDSVMPIRGPKKWNDKEWEYQCHAFGNDKNIDAWLSGFQAREHIKRGHRVVYVATFVGGLVNQSNWPKETRFWLQENLDG